MKVNFCKCKSELILLPVFNIKLYSYYDSVYEYIALTIGWLSRFVVFNITYKSNKPGFYYCFHLLPEINLVWFTKRYIYVWFHWLDFNKRFVIKEPKYSNKIKVDGNKFL